jgi:uncharacterized protein (DUF427 family)
MRHPDPDPAGPGEESVWDYPRPPRVDPEHRRIRVTLGGVVIADTRSALRVLETSHPPTYYLPPADVVPDCLRPASGSSFCEWKGVARYFDVEAGGRSAPSGAWSYPDPTSPFESLKDHVAFYCSLMDQCQVGDEIALPQPGGFYGGWVTSWIKGPFKGEPGTSGW